GAARQLGPRDLRAGRAQRAGRARRGRRDRAELVRARRVRHLPDAGDRRRAGPSRPVFAARRAGRQRSVPAVLLAREVGAPGAGPLSVHTPGEYHHAELEYLIVSRGAHAAATRATTIPHHEKSGSPETRAMSKSLRRQLLTWGAVLAVAPWAHAQGDS